MYSRYSVLRFCSDWRACAKDEFISMLTLTSTPRTAEVKASKATLELGTLKCTADLLAMVPRRRARRLPSAGIVTSESTSSAT